MRSGVVIMGWVIASVCLAGIIVSNRIIATLHPPGTFERIGLNFLAGAIWVCLGTAAGLIAAAPL